MPRKYVRKTERQKWDEKNLENAIKAVLKNQLTCVEAAKRFCVLRSTLARKVENLEGNAGDLKKIGIKGHSNINSKQITIVVIILSNKIRLQVYISIKF